MLPGLARRGAIRAAKASLRMAYRDRLVPLETVLRLRSFGDRPHIMRFRTSSVHTTGRALNNDFLAERLADREFGKWTLAAQALNVLEQGIQTHRPTRILELGSGLSTACIARYMSELDGPRDSTAVVSIEQDPRFHEETLRLLVDLGLDDLVSLYYLPLVPQRLGGRDTTCYGLNSEVVEDLRRSPPEMVFIDGPGFGGERFGVLPLLDSVVSQAVRFYLDDALADWGLETARLWKDLQGVTIQGVALAGYGLLVGEYEPPAYEPLPIHSSPPS